MGEIKENKKFKTHDGVDIVSGETFWIACQLKNEVIEFSDIEEYVQWSNPGRNIFSSKEKAEQYLKQLK